MKVEAWFNTVSADLQQHFKAAKDKGELKGEVFKDGYLVGLIDAMQIVKKSLPALDK